MDVKTTFLNGDLHEVVYKDQPEGFQDKGKTHKVCRLKKSIYGLKQASRQWYLKFHEVLTNFDFKENLVDSSIRFSKNNKTTGGSRHIDIKYLAEIGFISYGVPYLGRKNARIFRRKKASQKVVYAKISSTIAAILKLGCLKDCSASKSILMDWNSSPSSTRPPPRPPD
ncbi:uncharacterized protein LOC132309613 [Cornus florida]|uniref:uncharacterized protein LOC132309613 n=1 Tax=Cornus florida TaxID=4283 RepID=UPI00289E3B22|nr:uncharacterized protein LOC132309613 [Cornus florida]